MIDPSGSVSVVVVGVDVVAGVVVVGEDVEIGVGVNLNQSRVRVCHCRISDRKIPDQLIRGVKSTITEQIVSCITIACFKIVASGGVPVGCSLVGGRRRRVGCSAVDYFGCRQLAIVGEGLVT